MCSCWSAKAKWVSNKYNNVSTSHNNIQHLFINRSCTMLNRVHIIRFRIWKLHRLTPCTNAKAIFYSWEKSILRENSDSSQREILISWTTRNMTIPQHLINQFPFYCLVTKESFKLLVLKVVVAAYERWSLTIGSKYSDLTWKLLVFGSWGEKVATKY